MKSFILKYRKCLLSILFYFYFKVAFAQEILSNEDIKEAIGLQRQVKFIVPITFTIIIIIAFFYFNWKNQKARKKVLENDEDID